MADLIRTRSDAGEAVRRLRKTSRTKAVDLARRSGRSRDTINRLERGEEVTLGAFLAMLGAMGYAVEIVSAGLPTLDEMKHRFASLATDDDDDGGDD